MHRFFCLTASKTASKNEGWKTKGNLNQNKKNDGKNTTKKTTSSVCFKGSFFSKNAPLGFVFRVCFKG